MREYTLIRARRKTLGLQIKDGKVIVRAPMRLPKATMVRAKDSPFWDEAAQGYD